MFSVFSRKKLAAEKVVIANHENDLASYASTGSNLFTITSFFLSFWCNAFRLGSLILFGIGALFDHFGRQPSK